MLDRTITEANIFLAEEQIRLVTAITIIKRALRLAKEKESTFLDASLVGQLEALLDCSMEFCALLEFARRKIQEKDYGSVIDILCVKSGTNASIFAGKRGVLLADLIFLQAEEKAGSTPVNTPAR